MRRGSFRRRASGCAIGALAAFVAFPAGAQTPATAPPPEALAEPEPEGLGLVTLPLTDNGLLIGEVTAFSNADGTLGLPTARLITLIGSRLVPEARERLAARLSGLTTIDAAAARELETPISYDPERLELAVAIPVELRAQRGISMFDPDLQRQGPAEAPARVSAFLTARGSIDYVHRSDSEDKGFGNAQILLSAAVRAAGVVAETLALYRPGEEGPDFQRQASRLVYDDVSSPLRITAGDLLIVPRLFQNAPDAGGISIVRSYQLLQPMRTVRPTGSRTFRLTAPSTVEILVNGRSARRLRLEPGNYDVRDFPFAQGGNEIRVLVDQGAGPRELLSYNIFYDNAQLQRGIDEFAFYAGVRAQLGPRGPEYSDDWLVSGFYRRGLSDAVTAGFNFQGDVRSVDAGVEALWSSNIGLFGADFSVSRAADYGMGWAASLTFERMFSGAGTFNLRFETRSRNFAPLDSVPPSNPFEWEASAGISHSFSDRFYAGADATYSKGRDDEPDRSYYRGNLGIHLSPRFDLEVNGTYEEATDYRGFSVFASLTVRFGSRATLRGEWDGRYERARLAFTAFGGQDVGAWDFSADADHATIGGSFNAIANYTTERAQFGITHLATWDSEATHITDERTSLRGAFALVFADGRLALARPILNGFAIVEAHESAGGGSLIVNPVPEGHLAQSGPLGPAVVPDLTAYGEREIFIEPVGMPAGYDIGPGAYRLVAPYRGAYRIVVGSDYWLSASGRLRRIDGNPLRYVGGEAREVAEPDREPVAFFTSSDGSYSISGLRPGRWTLTMNTDPATRYDIEVAVAEDGIARLGDSSPVEN